MRKQICLTILVSTIFILNTNFGFSFTAQESQNGKTKIQFNLGEFQTESIGEYTRFTSPNSGSGRTTEEGMPELPLYSTLVQIDPDKEYQVNFSVLQSHTLKNVKVFPFQNDKEGKNPSKINHVNQEFYISGGTFPEKNLIVSDRLVMRGLQLLNISVVPFEYNPVGNEMVVYDEIEINLEESGTRESNEFIPPLRSRTFEKLYETMIVNYETSDRDEDYQQPAILYICGGNSESNSYFQQLVDWRHKRGYVVYTASLSETGSSSSQIKNYIENAYETFFPPPEYVALVGDASGSYEVPTFYEDWGHDYYGDWCEGDQPFSQLDGSDLLPEIIIGRISIRSSSDILNIVNKIINYEKATYQGSLNNFYDRAAIVGDPGDSGISTVTTAKYIQNVMETYGVDDINMKISGSSWTSWMENQLEEGVAYFQYRGFYNVSGFDNGDIDDVNNGHKLPFATVLTCGTGSFAQETTCLSEKFLRAGSGSTPKGAVAAVCTATGNTHTMFNNIIAMGIYEGLFPKGIETAGTALANGKLTLYNAYPSNPYNWVNAFSQWNSLMGDPATHLWTDTPMSFSVIHPLSLSVGTNFVDFMTIDGNGNPVEDAMVTLLMGNDIIFDSKYTDENGLITFNLEYIESGTISVTVTKRNFKPYEGMISLNSTGKIVNLDNESEIEINDGNDGNANPGEEIGLSIPLKNFGTQTVYGIEALLEATSEFVTITNPSVEYGTLSPGSSSVAEDFSLVLSESVINNEDLKLRLTIIDNDENEWNGIVSIEVEAPHLIIFDVNIESGSIHPGESKDISIVLSNRGSVSSGDISGILSSGSYVLSVVDGIGAWDTISPGYTSESNDSFTIYASDDIINGTVLTLNLKIETANGYNRTENISVQIGEVSESDPLGPDEYGYYIYDSWDSGYEMAPTYDWIEIESLGTNLDIYDPGYGRGVCSNNSNQYCNGDSDCGWGNSYCEFYDTTVDVNLPFSFSFYGVHYSTISVSSNGWIAFGQSDMESFRNYQIPGAGGPSPMIAVFWDDIKTSSSGDIYTYAGSGNDYFIVEWADVRTEDANSLENFQVILYNNSVPPNDDGEIKLQYNTFNNTSNGNFGGYTPVHGGYCTVGIEDHTGNDGLQFTYDNEYPVAARTLVNQSALFITTKPPYEIDETIVTVSNISGWNIVGLPVDANDSNYLTIFPNAVNNTLYSYNDGYTQETNLSTGNGYWLRFYDEGENQINGLTLHFLAISLEEGWNLISGISSSIQLTDIIDPDGIIVPGTMYSYSSEGYSNETALEPGSGYWIRSFENGVITLQNTGNLSKNNVSTASPTVEGLNSISFNSTELYFGGSVLEEDILSFSLPPKPPVGGFDVRFAGDLKYSEEFGEIEIINPGKEIVVSFEIINNDEYWVLSNSVSNIEFELAGTGIINIGNAEDKYILKKSDTNHVPETISLFPAYPNPFNPGTSLQYHLTIESYVNLTIYDMLGREVSQLVSEIQSPGIQSVQWNATDNFGKSVSAGIYLYQIQSGGFIQTKKMVLLK